MRIEVAGAQITTAVIDVIETLQTNTALSDLYARVLNELTNRLILDSDELDASDASALEHLRVLQMIRRDLGTLASPPDADDRANDTPAAQF